MRRNRNGECFSKLVEMDVIQIVVNNVYMDNRT